MNIAPIFVMNGILVALTVLLLIADRLLVTYGDCKITVRKGVEQQEFIVRGGGSLLSALIEHKIEISSSCAGRGTCGYCKARVVKGGGAILPTEELFMSRQEKHDNMRLACQVKIKNDVEVVIPDYLTVIKEMVRTKKFDPKKRWRVTIS